MYLLFGKNIPGPQGPPEGAQGGAMAPVPPPLGYVTAVGSVGLHVVRAHVPSRNEKGPGLEVRRALDVYGPPGGYGYGRWQVVARRSQ